MITWKGTVMSEDDAIEVLRRRLGKPDRLQT